MEMKQSESKKNKLGNQGFTLLEIMIGISIFTIGFLGIATMQAATTNANSTAKGVTESTQWAASRIENLIAMPYADIVAGSDSHDGYTVTWTVTQNSPIQNVKRIDITVTHRYAFQGASRETTFTYYKADSV